MAPALRGGARGRLMAGTPAASGGTVVTGSSDQAKPVYNGSRAKKVVALTFDDGYNPVALRQILAVGCRALVVAEQVSVPNAADAFDEMDGLRDARLASELKTVVRKLIELAKLVAGK